jgi:cytochrome c
MRSRRRLLFALIFLIPLIAGGIQLLNAAVQPTTQWLPLVQIPVSSPIASQTVTVTSTTGGNPTTTPTSSPTLDPSISPTATATVDPAATLTPTVTSTSTGEQPSPTLTATATTGTVDPGTATPTLTPTPSGPFKVLAFSKTAGYRHPAIPNALQALQELGAANNFTVDTSEDSSVFTDANLAQYAVVAFVMTSDAKGQGNVLNDAQQAAFERYIRAGGGYVGIHSASDTEYTWPWYGQLVGAYFKNHPQDWELATIIVEDQTHPSTAHLGPTWVRSDEWYNFETNPREQVHVLLRLDESTYEGGDMGDHPIAWCHDFDGGRSWYTGLSHDRNAYATNQMRLHLLGGIQYAAGVAGSCPT